MLNFMLAINVPIKNCNWC